MFLVKWQGYDNEDNTWEPLKNFDINQLVTEQKSQLVYGAEKIVGHRMVMGKVNEQKLRKKKQISRSASIHLNFHAGGIYGQMG